MQTAGGWGSVMFVLVIGLTTAHAACPPLHNANTIFKAQISWTYNTLTGTCTASHVGSHVVTEIAWGQTASVEGVGNDCLQFTCGSPLQGAKQLFFNSWQSSCALDTGCSSTPIEWEMFTGCSLEYQCVSAVYESSLDSSSHPSLTHSGHFSVFSGYTCGATGSGPCSSDECFNPYASASSGKQCLSRGQSYKSAQSNTLTCKELPTCLPDVTYLDLRPDVITVVQQVYVPVPVSSAKLTGSDKSAANIPDNNCPFDDKNVTAKTAFSGCYVDGICYAEGDVIPSTVKCLTLKCGVDRKTKVLYPIPKVSDIVDCRPSGIGCQAEEPGCGHNGKCHKVKGIVKLDDCTQFVCKGNNEWIPRPTGCYGLKGCVPFGNVYTDPGTNYTYRCRYNLNVAQGGQEDLFKYTKFYPSCVTPKKQRVAAGDSILSDDVWYSCRWNHRMTTVKVNASRSEDNTVCSENPDSGESRYAGIWYHFEAGQCVPYADCINERCTYYFYPCLNTDSADSNRWLTLGDTVTLEGSECKCTQHQSVGNINISDLSLNSGDVPYKYRSYLCGQKGVTGAACQDPEDSTLKKQWGELWEHSGDSTKICTCDPETRNPFCSSNLTEVLDTIL